MRNKPTRSSLVQQHKHGRNDKDELDDEEIDLDEIQAPPPGQNFDNAPSLEHNRTPSTNEDTEKSSLSREESGLDELFAPPPNGNPDEGEANHHDHLEHQSNRNLKQQESRSTGDVKQTKLSHFLIQFYVYSYLIRFSFLGVLARIGLQTLTLYPGALIPNTDLWANFAGSLFIGFLREDRTLFRRHWQKTQTEHDERLKESERIQESDTDNGKREEGTGEAAVDAAFRASRAKLPGYLGLTVGFCGSFTSFASICRDSFLAISNNINTDDVSNHFVTSTAGSRGAGYSVMAVMAVLLLEICMSIIALKIGAHLAIMTERLIEDATVNVNFSKILNPLFAFLGVGMWIGAVILSVLAPYGLWRGKVFFSLVFAPVGCILRF